jgi:hypothetical protein
MKKRTSQQNPKKFRGPLESTLKTLFNELENLEEMDKFLDIYS